MAELPPGPELDAKVVELFFGLNPLNVELRSFSTSPAACELVKAELVRRNVLLSIYHFYSGGVSVTLTTNERDVIRTTATTEAHAVALLAVAVARHGQQ